jgi:hypothetical protein
MAAYTAGPSGSGDTHTPQVISGSKKTAKKVTKKAAPKKASK